METLAQAVVVDFVAQGLERLVRRQPRVFRHQFQERNQRARRLTATGEQAHDRTASRCLISDFLGHVGFVFRPQRGVLGAQTAAHRRPLDRFTRPDLPRALPRRHRPVRDTVELPTGAVVLDELALVQRHQDPGQLEHGRQVTGRNTEFTAHCVLAHAKVQAGTLLDGPDAAAHRVDDHRGIRALEQQRRLADALPHRKPPRRRIALHRHGQRRKCRREMVFDYVHDHLAVVVAAYLMALRDQPFLQRVAIGDVAVVRAVEIGVAADHVRLGIGLVDRAERRPTHLTAEDLARQVDDAQRVDHDRGRTDALAQHGLLASILQHRACGIVAAVFQGLEQNACNFAKIRARLLVDDADDSAHDGSAAAGRAKAARPGARG